MYLVTFPTVMETKVMVGLAFMSPSRIVMAEPNSGTNAKNPM